MPKFDCSKDCSTRQNSVQSRSSSTSDRAVNNVENRGRTQGSSQFQELRNLQSHRRNTNTVGRVQELVDEFLDGRHRNKTDVLMAAAATVRDTQSFDDVLACEEELSRAGVVPIVNTFWAFAHACLRLGHPDEALEFVKKMSKASDKAESHDYGSLIPEFVSGGYLDEALEIFDEIGRTTPELLDVGIYNSLISGCKKQKRVEQAIALFNIMKTTDMAPDVVTYNALIGACVNEGKMEKADELLREGIKSGIFKESLGYDSKNHTLNFHQDAVMVHPEGDAHVPGVDSAVALTLFRHWASSFQGETILVTGHTGEHKIRDAIAEEMRQRKMVSKQQMKPNGDVNQGAFICDIPMEPIADDADRGQRAPTMQLQQGSTNPRSTLVASDGGERVILPAASTATASTQPAVIPLIAQNVNVQGPTQAESDRTKRLLNPHAMEFVPSWAFKS